MTYGLCVSSERKDKDRAIRESHEKRLVEDLEKLKRRLAKGKGKGTQPGEVLESMGRLKERDPRVARYYRVDQQQRAKAGQLDGGDLWKTPARIRTRTRCGGSTSC